MTADSTRSHTAIMRDLLARIVDGEFAPGTTLPSESKLSQHYGAARGTVRNALAALEGRGLVAPVQGSGWVVRSSRQNQSFAELRSFAQWARSKGMTPGGLVRLAEFGEASQGEARSLRVAPSSRVIRVTRTRSLDGRTVMLERTCYPEWIADKVASIPDDEASVVETLRTHFGVDTAHAEHSIDAIPASSADAELLGIRRSSPLLRVRRVSFTRGGAPIEFGEDRYLPDTVTFQVATSSDSNALNRAEFLR
ncbi:GntR family transcriptional regulator [Leucobacter komagatae]|uniref:GntR family transcriptional regulator n=1 Tax=Leucobacter komagatae TaxID=55969 RepID=A0A542Y5Q6_9MICO|nr:GntR family transcriptional regulator [Leucobacter komagatae]TQL43414.1 GntR family transcriptional regulator [Leucobacter komagatae]